MQECQVVESFQPESEEFPEDMGVELQKLVDAPHNEAFTPRRR